MTHVVEICGEVNITNLRVCAEHGICGLVRNARQERSASMVDIAMARQGDYIVVDASGVIGFTTENAGQRDVAAQIAVDKNNERGR